MKSVIEEHLPEEPLLFETIKIEEGKAFNLFWHNKRFNHSRKRLFNSTQELKLEAYISPPSNDLYRCKVTYNESIQSVAYFPYQAKVVNKIKIIESHLDYTYKYLDRSEIEQLYHPDYDEIIIEKNGLLTDSTIANIAFFDGKSWLTPAKPLLEGTTRARLLHEGFLKLDDIKKENLKNYSHFALMNAMIGFRIQKSVCIQT